MAKLKASFDYCDPIYQSMTDGEGAPEVKWARWDMSKLGLLNELEHLARQRNVRHHCGVSSGEGDCSSPSSEGRP